MDKPNYNDEVSPDFGSTEFLLDHIHSILRFYDGRCSDIKGGGFFQHFKVNKIKQCYKRER